jgi:hypothetical protein
VSKLVAIGGGRLGLATTLAVFLTLLQAGPGIAMPEGGSVAHELIVGFRHGASATERQRTVAAVDGRVKRRLGEIGAVLIRVPGGVGPAVERLERRGDVRYAEPNFLLSVASVPNDPGFQQLWGLDNVGQLINFSFGTPDADVDAREAWDVTSGGGTVVGILDTGVDMAHPDLAANIWRNAGENCAGCRSDGIDNDGNGYVDDWRGWDFANDDNDPSDDHGHGTHVAGTIGAVGDNGLGIAGVNWSARLMALKFVRADGSGTTADAIEALTYAADNGATVTNNSYVSPDFSQAFADAVALTGERGSLMVAAAGNSGSSNDLSPQYPASFDAPSVVSVAATNNRDQRSYFSNYGRNSVDLGAPGESIYSTWPGGGYQYQSGTSMATPHVAGAAALAEAAFPGSTPAGIKALLLRTVDPNAALTGKTTAEGRLNVNTAVRCSGAGQAWIESPAPNFVAVPGEELRVSALAGACGSAAGVTVTANANGTPVTLTPRGDGSYTGTYTASEPGPLSISVTAAGPAGADVETVSGAVATLIAADGPPVTVTAASPDENPRLAFQGTAGQRVSLEIGGVTMGTSTCCGAKVSITGPDGSRIVAPTNVGTKGGFIDATTLPKTGVYSLLVDPQGSVTGSATLTLHDVPPDATAAIEPAGVPVSVQTATPGQNARLRFDALPGDRVSAIIGPICCAARVSIVAPDGSAVGNPTSLSSSGGFIDTRTLTQAGTYTLLVDPSGAATGAATITLYDVPADATAAIVPGGAPVGIATTTPGQNSSLNFDGRAGQSVSLKVGPLCCSARVSIVAPDGSTAFGTVMSSNGGFVEPITLQQTGAYRIALDPQGAVTGSATLTLYDVPADAAAAIVPGGAAVSLATTTPGQNASFDFSGSAGQAVSLSAGPLCCTSKLSIVAAGGSAIFGPKLMGTSGGFVDATTLPATGAYSIVLDPQSAATGSSTLRLFAVPPDLAATTSIGGPPLTLALTVPGQNATVVFDGSAGRTITLQLSGVTITQSKVAVTNPDGSALVSAQTVYTIGKTITAQLVATGAHTISVNPLGAYVGSMTLVVR